MLSVLPALPAAAYGPHATPTAIEPWIKDATQAVSRQFVRMDPSALTAIKTDLPAPLRAAIQGDKWSDAQNTVSTRIANLGELRGNEIVRRDGLQSYATGNTLRLTIGNSAAWGGYIIGGASAGLLGVFFGGIAGAPVTGAAIAAAFVGTFTYVMARPFDISPPQSLRDKAHTALTAVSALAAGVGMFLSNPGIETGYMGSGMVPGVALAAAVAAPLLASGFEYFLAKRTIADQIRSRTTAISANETETKLAQQVLDALQAAEADPEAVLTRHPELKVPLRLFALNLLNDEVDQSVEEAKNHSMKITASQSALDRTDWNLAAIMALIKTIK